MLNRELILCHVLLAPQVIYDLRNDSIDVQSTPPPSTALGTGEKTAVVEKKGGEVIHMLPRKNIFWTLKLAAVLGGKRVNRWEVLGGGELRSSIGGLTV